jgi:hypothetical protein
VLRVAGFSDYALRVIIRNHIQFLTCNPQLIRSIQSIRNPKSEIEKPATRTLNLFFSIPFQHCQSGAAVIAQKA